MHILYVVGNRPQFIKLAMLHKEIKKNGFVKETVLHTGQHFSAGMSDIFFDELAIEIPIINLSIHSLSHVAMIGRTIEALEAPMKKLAPDLVVVFGDTNATLAGALTAKKLHLPLAHIEAGIRTFDESMPEESNRYLTDRLADLNFCCTHLGVQHLQKEGFDGRQVASKVVNSGDIMLDAFCYFDAALANKPLQNKKEAIPPKDFILTTIHRRHNIESKEALSNIIDAFNSIHQEIPVVCPVHPATKHLMAQYNLHCQFTVLPPQGYVQMQKLLRACRYVITDSGGLQREAFFAQKPMLVLMEKPFWPEVITHGNALSCASQSQKIKEAFEQLKCSRKNFDLSVFGNGHAAGIIAGEIIQFCNANKNTTV